MVRTSIQIPLPVRTLQSAGSSQTSGDRVPGFFTPRAFDDADPSSSSSPGDPDDESGNRSDGQRVSDHEYEVRVGRAYDLLRATIPEFMRAGVVDYDQQSGGESRPSNAGLSLLDVLAFRTLRERAAEAGLVGSGEGSGSSSSQEIDDVIPSSSTDERSFHQNIHFRFCANASASSQRPDLTDEEAASLSFSGRNLYFASAQILRNTLNVLFADSSVVIESIRRDRRGGARGWNGHGNAKQQGTGTGGVVSEAASVQNASSFRNDSIHLRVGFVGHLRVTGAEHRYTLIFRYDIDDQSGRIARHTVERVEPAIGRKLWSGLAAVWSRLTGQSQQPEPIATAVPASLLIGRPHRSSAEVSRERLCRTVADRASSSLST